MSRLGEILLGAAEVFLSGWDFPLWSRDTTMAFNLPKLLTDVFDPQKGERVLVMYDLPHGRILDTKEWKERRKMAEEWHQAFVTLGKEREFFVHPLLSYAATGQHNGPLPAGGEMGGKAVSIESVIKETTLAVALTEYSATAPLVTLAKTYRFRAASMPSVTKAMEKTALAADYTVVRERCRVLAEKLTDAVGASIEFSSGHQLYLDLREREVEADDGFCGPTKIESGFPLINLPSGEAFQVPYEGEDKTLGPSKTRGELPERIGKETVVYVISNNQIIDVRGTGPEAKKMKTFFSEDPARANIAELGLGCNPQAIVRGNVLEDEKVGPHIAYGRSDHLGGVIGVKSFLTPEHVVHQDIVYAKGCPISMRKLVLEYKDSVEDVIIDSEYVVF